VFDLSCCLSVLVLDVFLSCPFCEDYDYALAHPEEEWLNRARVYRDKYFNSGYMQVGRELGNFYAFVSDLCLARPTLTLLFSFLAAVASFSLPRSSVCEQRRLMTTI
jgi:hypothetical protein